MVATLALTLAWAQSAAIPLGPTVPAGANRSFHEASMKVQEHLRAGQFAEANRQLGALPRAEFRLSLDLAEVPAAERTRIQSAVRQAVDHWANAVPGLKPSLDGTETPAIRIGFADQLPENDQGLPQGAIFMMSTSPEDPRVDAVIGLHRGRPRTPSLNPEIANEVSFAIASYLGFEATTRPAFVTTRSDLPGSGFNPVMAREAQGARNLLKSVDTLRQFVEARRRVEPARPRLFLEQRELTLPTIRQGEPSVFDFQVTNPGNAPLSLRVESECACYVPSAPDVIEPGQSGLVRVGVNSQDFVGKLRKKIRFLSNDADFPTRDVEVAINVIPQFRLLKPDGDLIGLDEEMGGEATFYLLTSKDVAWKPTVVRLDGFRHEATFEPWSGEIADPEIGEPKRPRTGYRIRVNLEPQKLNGRAPASLVIVTDSPDLRLRELRRNFVVQRGIVSSPNSVFFGEVAPGIHQAFTVLTRAGGSFKVTRVESDNPYVTAVARFRPDRGDFRLDVTLSEKAPTGMFSAQLKIHTDDPKQPLVEVPVQGFVK